MPKAFQRLSASYRLRAAHSWFPSGGVPGITADALRAALVQTTVQRLTGSLEDGSYEVQLGMQRDSHSSALDEIGAGLAQFGFAFREALICEWIRQIARGAIVGAVSVGSGAAMRKCDPSDTAAAASLGAFIGGAAGSFVHQEVPRYLARRDAYTGLWRIASLQLPQPGQLRFGYA